MSASAASFLRQIRELHRNLEQLYATTAATADDPRVAMLLGYISDGHGRMHELLTRNLRGVAPGVLELECRSEFDFVACQSGIARRLHESVSFEEVMTSALGASRQLHAALESAADHGDDRRLVYVLRRVLQQSREARNRLSFNAGLLRDF